VAVTAQATGTLTTDASEQTLADIAAAGTYLLMMDLNDMVEGDTVEVRVYAIILTGGTRRVAYYLRRDDLQPADDKILVTVPISNELTDAGSIRFSCKGTTTSGTISLPWKVLKFS
jgi:hypothetical protein